ncbi:flavin-binding monooxygenase-like protein [Talaromyces stipitatus ATCC 10500]|uniref:Flavin-binding monooxygenase-like protein n=1 Tax=Talaromyces stipitatus (strain ATCC 10500 / CBS 375.48 / QM 6759 / NRRL 1006) TaxID=441959 RepID=B8MAD6_TALSN|nr:flavin-binding monooxygenase-like protein [Talaromyces stipitatus ATCC 10500]EED18638.1 flavin-binding monooxygenase-like protein [Talaromyces stipitatus ATCC 10500]
MATPSKDRVEPGSVNIPIGKYPSTVPLDPSGSPPAVEIASKLVEDFNQALANKDPHAISQLFFPTGYWRDHLALSWDFHTLSGRESIAKFLSTNGIRITKVELDISTAARTPHFGPIDGGLGEANGVEFFIKFTSDIGSGNGVARVAEESAGQWRFFLLSTTLSELTGHERRINRLRPKGVEHGGDPNRQNWKERRAAEINLENRQPQVIIIGAGQAGLTVAASLKLLGVETLIIDREDHIGDNWRNRYRHLVLHDPVWMDHLPYMPFPPTWPIFTPKDKLADFLESYASFLELNVWTKTNLTSSSWDDSTKQWAVTVERQKEDGSKESRTFKPHHVILATGHSGKKNFPTIKGMDSFAGDRLCHSSEFTGAFSQTDSAKPKKAVVVGCCNSGHDIAQDFYEKGYDITMVQRSSTLVVSSTSILAVYVKSLFDEDGPATEDADLWIQSFPAEVFKGIQIKATDIAATQIDAEIISGLEKVGFKVDRGPDDGGIFMKYYQRGGGYYIDVGASQLIIDGKIKIKQGQEITQILPHGIEFADGSVLEADEIVFATGYQNMRTEARHIFGDTVADRLGSVWGYDKEGEFRSIWRPSGHPGFWYMGGNLALCRYYSKLLALQIKAIEEGLNTVQN